MVQLNLSASELEIMIEILEHQREKLLVETRHTDTRKFRVDLQQRLDTVESLISRANAARPAMAARL